MTTAGNLHFWKYMMVGENSYALRCKTAIYSVWNCVRCGTLASLLGVTFIGCEAIPAMDGYFPRGVVYPNYCLTNFPTEADRFNCIRREQLRSLIYHL